VLKIVLLKRQKITSIDFADNAACQRNNSRFGFRSILLFIQLLRTKPYGPFQFTNTSDIMNPLKYFAGILGRGISPTQNSTTQRHGHTSMSRAGFEPTIPQFERLRPTPQTDRLRSTEGVKSFFVLTCFSVPHLTCQFSFSTLFYDYVSTLEVKFRRMVHGRIIINVQ
jgi:hypothetical protein